MRTSIIEQKGYILMYTLRQYFTAIFEKFQVFQLYLLKQTENGSLLRKSFAF